MKPKAMIFKRLTVKPSGMITGGFIQYNADDVSGVVEYNGEVDVHFLFVNPKYTTQGTTVVDPALLMSANITPGKKFQVSGVSIEVISVADQKANCKVTVDSGSVKAEGTAILDLSQKDISVDSLVADGSVMGASIHLEVA